MGKKTPPEVIARMRELRSAGMSYLDIAEEVECSKSLAIKYTKDITPPPQPFLPPPVLGEEASEVFVPSVANPSPQLKEERENTERLNLQVTQAVLSQRLKEVKGEDVPEDVLKERAEVEKTELALRKAKVSRELRKLQESETQEAEMKELKEKTLKRKRWVHDWQQRILNQIPPEIFMFDDLEQGLKLAIDHQLKHRTEDDDPQRIETNLLQMAAFITHRYYVVNKLPIPQLQRRSYDRE